VYQNGVLLKGGGNDYTATSGTSVVLATGASVNDVIEIIVYDAFSAANFYSRTDSDSRYVNVDGDSMTGDLELKADSARLKFGADSEVILRHSADNGLQLEGSGLNTNFTINAFHATDSTTPDLDLHKSGSSTVGTQAATADGEALGQIRFSGVDTSGSSRTAATISAAQVGTASDAVSSNLTIDAGNFIILDADGGRTRFADNGTIVGSIQSDNNNFNFVGEVSDGDIVFSGNDGGSGITAAFFDMSDGGTYRTGNIGSANPGAGSNGVIIANGEGGILITGGSSALRIYSTSSGVPTAQISAAGALAKTSGSFKIDHPLESKKDTHYLVHSFIEGPQADLIYRGKVTLSAGTATINVDTATGMTEGTFVALNRETQCFTTNETGWTAIKGSISGNTLTITAQDNSCTDTISWMVIGERHDPHMKDSGTDWTDSDGKVILEPEKESE
jgi:hypothetical protein